MNSPFSENFVSIKDLFALHALITLLAFSMLLASLPTFGPGFPIHVSI